MANPMPDQGKPVSLPPELAAAKLLDTAQAAEYLGGLSVRTLEDWRRLKTGPDYVPIAGKRIRYRVAALDAYIDAIECKLSKGAA